MEWEYPILYINYIVLVNCKSQYRTTEFPLAIRQHSVFGSYFFDEFDNCCEPDATLISHFLWQSWGKCEYILNHPLQQYTYYILYIYKQFLNIKKNEKNYNTWTIILRLKRTILLFLLKKYIQHLCSTNDGSIKKKSHIRQH